MIQAAKAHKIRVMPPSRVEREVEAKDAEGGSGRRILRDRQVPRRGFPPRSSSRTPAKRLGAAVFGSRSIICKTLTIWALFFRAAAFFGAQGILLTQERSAPLSAVVYDVASGGLEYVPFTLQINLQRAFEIAKDAGLWILGTSEHAKDGVDSIERDRPWLLVLGNEEKGMRRLTEESCDVLCKIPCRAR